VQKMVATMSRVAGSRSTVYVEHNGTKVSQLYDLTVVVGAGTASSITPSPRTKGVGRDRFAAQVLKKLRNDEQNAQSLHASVAEVRGDKEHIEVLKGELASTRLEMQRIVELTSPNDKNRVTLCPTVEKMAGFVQGKDDNQTKAPKRFGVVAVANSLKRTRDSVSPTHPNTTSPAPPKTVRSARKQPIVLPTMNDIEVKRRTGFCDAYTLLAFVVIVCNGDVEQMRTRRSSLTWFEEWFLYFEWKYHTTNIRQQDMEVVWGINHRCIIKVKDYKAALDMAAFRSWPRFASFEEDKQLRDPEKWARYDKYRVIQWDMTNVPAPKFSNASLHRATYSQYYGMNCAKGGVGVQLCGWVTAERAWTGAVEDGTYHSKAGYAEAQKEFQEADLVDGKVIKFHNILDRGYRGNATAFRQDQLCLQPPSARSDRRFTGKQTIYAGAVARDRSGNERGVKVMKRSGLYKRGFKENMSSKRFCDALLTWGFQVNFMYKPIH
jgi:hypothetical protein